VQGLLAESTLVCLPCCVSVKVCAIESALFERVSQPYVRDGQRTGALRFGDSRVAALTCALCLTVHAVAGFNNRSLRALVAGLLGTTYTSVLS
jgi:hypothetical protein